MNRRVGILAIQGDFSLHFDAFARIGAKPALIRYPHELDSVDSLVIPGGESTTLHILIERFSFRQPLIDFGKQKPMWGTCAGMILLAQEVDDPRVTPLGLMDISVSRNAYGRQVHSFIDTGQMISGDGANEIEMVFIRAPKLLKAGPRVEVIARWKDEPTMVRQGHLLASSFHPELTDQTMVQEYFLSI